MPKRCQECRQEYTGPHHTDCPGLRPPVLPEPRGASPEQRPAVAPDPSRSGGPAGPQPATVAPPVRQPLILDPLTPQHRDTVANPVVLSNPSAGGGSQTSRGAEVSTAAPPVRQPLILDPLTPADPDTVATSVVLPNASAGRGSQTSRGAEVQTGPGSVTVRDPVPGAAVTGRLLSIGPPLREYRWRNPLFLAIVFTVGLFSRQARGPAMHTFGQPYEVESWSMQVLDEQTGRSVAVVLVDPAGAVPEVGSRVAVFGARRRQNIEAERIRMLEDRHGNPMPGEVEWRNRRML